jgi:hypothetical protein
VLLVVTDGIAWEAVRRLQELISKVGSGRDRTPTVRSPATLAALGLSSPVSGLYPMSPARLSTSGSIQGWPTEAPRGPEGLRETSREATAV